MDTNQEKRLSENERILNTCIVYHIQAELYTEIFNNTEKDRRQPDVSTRPPAVVIYLYHTFYYRGQQYSSRPAIHIHQSLSGCG